MKKTSVPTTSLPGNTRTLEEAKYAVRKLTAIGQPTFGIFLNTPGSQAYVPADEAGVTEGDWIIRCKAGKPSDDDNFVAGHGEYQSADKVLDLIEKATNPQEAITQLLQMFNPGMTPEATNSRIMAMAGVQDRFNKAVRLAWEAA